MYRLLADAAMVSHFGFLAYVTVGGFIAWRIPRTIPVHVAAVGWGFATVVAGIGCPLTQLEDWARSEAGQAGLPPTGFIDHYLTGVVYPEDQLATVRVLVATVVLASWAGYALRHVGGMDRMSQRTT
ncbi:MAG TPA: DUF2784 domain-containing protein [Jiangellaceae bacterium]